MSNALTFATTAHANQFRKGSGLPYICHPIDVLSKVHRWGIVDPVVWKACVCHDIEEDCPTVSKRMIVDFIGQESADIVSELTFIPDKSLAISVADQKLKYMESFMSKSIQAVVIKIADRICNTTDFVYSDLSYAQKYWYKASNLFNVATERIEEIDETFGDAVAAQILFSIDTKHSWDGLFF